MGEKTAAGKGSFSAAVAAAFAESPMTEPFAAHEALEHAVEALEPENRARLLATVEPDAAQVDVAMGRLLGTADAENGAEAEALRASEGICPGTPCPLVVKAPTGGGQGVVAVHMGALPRSG